MNSGWVMAASPYCYRESSRFQGQQFAFIAQQFISKLPRSPFSLCLSPVRTLLVSPLTTHTHKHTPSKHTNKHDTHTHTQVERTVSTWLSCCARHTLCGTSIGHRQVLNYVRRSTPTNDTAALQTTLWNCWPDSCSICRLTDETGKQSYIKPQSGSKCHTV